MPYMEKAVCDLTPGDRIEGFYIINNALVKVSANGKPFLSCTVSDRTGSIEAKMWDYTGSIDERDNGVAIKLRADVTEYKGALQLKLMQLRLAEEGDGYDLSDLIPCAPIDPDEALDRIRSLISGIADQDYRRIAESMLSKHLDAFSTIPAAKSVHHSFLHGLLMHTYNMLKLADYLSLQYADILDRSLLIAGTLLHDFAKEREFCFSPLGLVTDYSVSGQLLGHLVMGAQEVCEEAKRLGIPDEKSMLLQHLILSHHGEPEFGAAVLPRCAEAELLSYIDRIDSRMEIYRETLADTAPGEFSGKVFALDGKRLYRSTTGLSDAICGSDGDPLSCK